MPGACVTVLGAPGVGKTAVAREVCAALRRDGRRVVSVALEAGLDDVAQLVRVGVAAGGAVRSDERAVWFAAVRRALEAEPTVLYVDGPGAGSAGGLLHELLAAAPRLCVLLCAWQRVGGPRELTVPLAPLSVDDGVRLLRQLGADAEDEAALREVAASTGGLPLALELVAAQLRALGLRVVQAQAPATRSAAPLERSIAAAVAGLSSEAAEDLARLAVFCGAFDGALATRALGGSRGLERLTLLVERSLVHRLEADGWFRVLDGIRDFVLRASPPELVEAARRAHCALFAAPTPVRPHTARELEAVAARRDELLAAWRWAIDRADARTQALELARTLDAILLTQGPGSLHRELLTRSLAGAPPDSEVTLDVLLALGRMDGIRGRHALALDAFRAARTQAAARGDERRLGWACAYVAYSAGHLGLDAEAAEAVTQALAHARRSGELPLLAMAEVSRGTRAQAHGDPSAAAAAYRRAMAAGVVAQAPRVEGIGAGNLGAALLEAGRLTEARAALARGRQAFLRAQDAFHLVRLSVDEARLAVAEADPGAEALVQRAIDEARAAGVLEGELLAREASVQLAQRRGEAAAAEERLAALDAVAVLSDDPRWPARVDQLRAARRARTLRLTHDGRRVEWAGRSLDFSRRGPLRRTLVALASAHAQRRSLSSQELREAGWPGEAMRHESAAKRVHMAVARLRALGFEAVLLTQDDGYRLSTDVAVEWAEATAPAVRGTPPPDRPGSA